VVETECSQCGVCCRLFLINLNEEEYKSGRFRTVLEEFGIEEGFKDAEMEGANLLAQNEDESCIYLEGNKCSIHEDRPQVCRRFFCTSKNRQFAGMIKKIKEYKSGIKR
jgi:Fe-S-cluster containining protein